MSYNVNNEMYHYGVKGMKWGVRRRYQNADGSLTESGKKKISKQYLKRAKKVERALIKNQNRMYIKSHNKAADYMNNGGIDKFNESQRKKYGKNYANRDGYASDYEKAFSKELAKQMNKTLKEFYDNNKNYRKSKELVDKYNMTKWDHLAKTNTDQIDKLRRVVEKGN